MDTARLWVLRVNEPDFSGWDAFAEWLEADPANLTAYETALAEDAWARDVAAAQAARQIAALPQTVPPPRRPWRYAVPGALAASLVGVTLWFGVLSGPDITRIATAPGEQREIALADGSQITVNGNSLISFDADTPRKVTLERGEALFIVQHNEAHPFVVLAGATRLIDAGTVFNVSHEAGALEVAVSEGAVIYRGSGPEVRLEPGDVLARAAPDASAQVQRADPQAVGSWRSGVLQYDNAPLASIARDLSRAFGKPVRARGGAATLRYTGTLSISGDDRAALGAMAALLGVEITETDEAWEMSPADAPPS